LTVVPSRHRPILLTATIATLALVTAFLQVREVSRIKREKAESPLLATKSPAPELETTSPAGDPVQLSVLRGKAVIVSLV
jgi:hypothetical protein